MSKVIDWKKVAKNAVTKCHKCGSKKGYMNPFATCYECKKRFCFDCIWAGLINSKMGNNEEIRKVCDSCKEEHGYKDL